MSFHSTAAQSSRITKRRKTPSPFAALRRGKPLARSNSSKGIEEDAEEDDDLLEDLGIVQALATDQNLRDVAQAVMYIHERRWSVIPEQRSGMSSTRIAEVLNLRASMPPLVSVRHVQALLNSPTTAEREMAELIHDGTLRKLVVPGRDEMLVLVRDLDRQIQTSRLDSALKDRFIALLHQYPTVHKLSRAWLSDADVHALMRAGFLTHAPTTLVTSRAGDASRGTAISILNISRAASGSLAAVGGQTVVHESGGSVGGPGVLAGRDLSLSLPGMGTLLKLTTAAQEHMVALLTKSKTREMPETLLKQRWDGGIDANDHISASKRLRGEFAGVAPGKTRKWKHLYGLTYESALGETIGMGQIEIFQTTVGRAVRLLR